MRTLPLSYRLLSNIFLATCRTGGKDLAIIAESMASAALGSDFPLACSDSINARF